MAELLSEKLGLRSSVEVGESAHFEMEADVLCMRKDLQAESIASIEEDRRATVEAVAQWLESQPGDTGYVVSAWRIRRELLAPPSPKETQDG